VIQRRAGVSSLEQIFSWRDAGELSRSIEGAGFRSIDVEPVSKTSR
jgi:hypothetical protein